MDIYKDFHVVKRYLALFLRWLIRISLIIVVLVVLLLRAQHYGLLAIVFAALVISEISFYFVGSLTPEDYTFVLDDEVQRITVPEFAAAQGRVAQRGQDFRCPEHRLARPSGAFAIHLTCYRFFSASQGDIHHTRKWVCDEFAVMTEDWARSNRSVATREDIRNHVNAKLSLYNFPLFVSDLNAADLVGVTHSRILEDTAAFVEWNMTIRASIAENEMLGVQLRKKKVLLNATHRILRSMYRRLPAHRISIWWLAFGLVGFMLAVASTFLGRVEPQGLSFAVIETALSGLRNQSLANPPLPTM